LFVRVDKKNCQTLFFFFEMTEAKTSTATVVPWHMETGIEILSYININDYGSNLHRFVRDLLNASDEVGAYQLTNLENSTWRMALGRRCTIQGLVLLLNWHTDHINTNEAKMQFRALLVDKWKSLNFEGVQTEIDQITQKKGAIALSNLSLRVIEARHSGMSEEDITSLMKILLGEKI
jgi:hypothetical protein